MTHYAVQSDLELETLPPQPPEWEELQAWATAPGCKCIMELLSLYRRGGTLAQAVKTLVLPKDITLEFSNYQLFQKLSHNKLFKLYQRG